MKFTIETPTKAYVEEFDSSDLVALAKNLSYTNTANQHALKRHYNNHWFKNKNRTTWESQLEELKASVHNCLLFKEDGRYFIRPASLSYLGIPDNSIVNKIQYPEPKKVPWAKPLPFELYDYQKNSVEKLMEIKHGSVSITTGGGKTAIILKLLREFGLPSVVVVPSAGIFNELLEKMEHHFGKGLVGALGDGKKRLGKKFTIAISDSLVNIKHGTEEWDHFYNKSVFISDEIHTLPSETLEKVCHGVLANVPYRLGLSATHTRGDGGLKLLQSITGPIVYELTTEDAVKGGYVCPHEFRIVQLESSNPNFQSGDILEMKRKHYLNNRNITAFAARLANTMGELGQQTLILVEELGQISNLVKLLKVPYAYAHSETKKERLEELGLTKVDVSESIEAFNKNEIKVLIGTSTIRTGVNIYSMTNTINFIGGASEVNTLQGAVGRSVRLHDANPWKDKCFKKEKVIIWDFDVTDVYPLKKHLEDRISYYEKSGSTIKSVKIAK